MSRVHYKGKNDDFFVFLDSVEDFHKWLKDSTVPLAHVVQTFKIFCTHKYVAISEVLFYSLLLLTASHSRHGNQGMYDGASNADLDNEFGTHVDSEVVEKILRQGTLTEGHVSVPPQ
jgi:hypothetical protein